MNPKGNTGFGRVRTPESNAKFEQRQRDALKRERSKLRRDERLRRVRSETRGTTEDMLEK